MSQYARAFRRNSVDQIDFGDLSPLASSSSWTVIALIKPDTKESYSAIVSKRADFSPGSHCFTFWLKDGAITIEADDSNRKSGLVPVLNQWSYVAASSSSEATSFYLGVGGDIQSEARKGLCTGISGAANPPLLIGKLANNFPGAIAFVCLYSTQLSDALMRDVCSGKLRPESIESCCFSWFASETIEVDSISKAAPNIIGTKLVELPVSLLLLPRENSKVDLTVPPLVIPANEMLQINPRKQTVDSKQSWWKKATKNILGS